MAFRKDKTTAAQTSANVAGSVVTALIEKGELAKVDEVAEAVIGIFQALFDELSPVVEADNKVFEAAEAAEPKSSSKRERKTSGGGRKGGKVTVKDARDMALKGGAFKGVTLGELLDIDAEDADADYDYGDGERDGRDYLSWLASDRNENDYTRERARVLADAEGISY